MLRHDNRTIDFLELIRNLRDPQKAAGRKKAPHCGRSIPMDAQSLLANTSDPACDRRGSWTWSAAQGYPTADGTCERDFIHVCDLAAAHVAALRYLYAGTDSLTLNLGTGQRYSVRKVVETVERVTGREVPVERAARREGDPPALVADANLARELIGFAPRFSDLGIIVETAWRARVSTTWKACAI
jgi:UDP-glucose 4-epimerase